MARVVILYAAVDKKKDQAVKNIASAFEKLKNRVVVKRAGDAAMTDILAADIIILGSDGASPVDPAFTEIQRALAGVNLAGRLAGILDCANGSDSVFRDALKDSDIEIFDKDLPVKKVGAGAIKSWVKKINGQYREIERAGEI